MTPADDAPTVTVPADGGLSPAVVVFWRRFLADRPEARARGLYEASAFGDEGDAATADECAALVLAGIKTATCGPAAPRAT